jgi:hypothetical protein
VIAACAQAHGLGSVPQQREASGIGTGDVLEHLAVGLGVGADALKPEILIMLALERPGGTDPGGDLGGALARRRQHKVGGADGGHPRLLIWLLTC